MRALNRRVKKLEKKANIGGDIRYILITHFSNAQFITRCKRDDGSYVCPHPGETLDEFMQYCVQAGLEKDFGLIVEAHADVQCGLGTLDKIDCLSGQTERLILPPEKELTQEEEIAAWEKHYQAVGAVDGSQNPNRDAESLSQCL